MRAQFGGYFSTPQVVKNLIIINVLVYFAQNFLSPEVGLWFDQRMALHYWQSPYFEPYQFVTHMFMHASVSHLFFNMFAFWMFGRVLESDLGSKRFLIYYMITGLGAAALHMGVLTYEFSTYAGMNPNVITVGASGAVFGVLLGFGMMHPNDRIMLLIPPIPMKAKYFVIGYGLLELVLGFSNMSGTIAHFAHVGGMLFGYILLKYWKIKGKIYY